MQRERYVAAFACLRDALEAGVAERELADEIREIETALGPALTAWKAVRIAANTDGLRQRAPHRARAEYMRLTPVEELSGVIADQRSRSTRS